MFAGVQVLDVDVVERCRCRPGRGWWRWRRTRPGCRRPTATGRTELSPLPLTPVSEVEAKHDVAGGEVLHVDVAERVGVGGVEVGGVGVKATRVPSAESDGRRSCWPLPLTPVSEVEASVMSPVVRSLT